MPSLRFAAILASAVALALPTAAHAAPAHHPAVRAHAAEASPWDIFALLDNVMKTINDVNHAMIRNLQ